jgi:Putative zinc-finger
VAVIKIVHCLEYISEYLAAHADDELSPSQYRAAEAHLKTCLPCQAHLLRERTLKQIIRQQNGLTRAPAELRLRIRSALSDTASSPATAAMRFRAFHRSVRRANDERSHPEAGRPASIRPARRKRIWIPIAITGLLVLFIFLTARLPRQPATAQAAAVPAFDIAINKYLQFGREFEPNVPPEAFNSRDGMLYAWVIDRDSLQRVADDGPESDDISRSYRDVDMPDDLFDFSAAGYHIAGGRVDRLPNGRRVTYTMYSGDAGQILGLCFSDASMAAPVGAVNWVGMRSFYTYKGYSICLSFYPTDHFVSILVTRMPLQQLLREVANTDSVTISQR